MVFSVESKSVESWLRYKRGEKLSIFELKMGVVDELPGLYYYRSHPQNVLRSHPFEIYDRVFVDCKKIQLLLKFHFA